MKVKNFLNVMHPTRRYKVSCNGSVAEFEPDETLPDIIASAELIRSTKDKETGCAVLEIKAMEMCRQEYGKHFGTMGGINPITGDVTQPGIFTYPKVFQFPKEEEV